MNRTLAAVVAAIVIAGAAFAYFTMGSSDESSPAPEVQSQAGTAVGAVPSAERVASVRYDERGVAIGGVEPNPSGGVPLDIDNIIANHDKAVIVSRDEADTFTVPLPGDPQWADYLEYRRAFRTVLDNSPGFVTPYDPEWRTQLSGVREIEDPQFELFGGSASLRELLQQVLDALAAEDEQAMVDLAIRKEEFEIICWPAFPQSRPYLRYKWEEAWGFQYAGIVGGIKEGVRRGAGRTLTVSSVAYDEIKDYGNFRLYNGVKVGAVDQETGESLEFEFIDSVIERNGVFKVYIYAD